MTNDWLLPDGRLAPGLYVIETADPWTTALHRAVVGYLECHGGPATWIDALDNARLFSRIEDPNEMPDIRFSGAFHVSAHYELVRTLPGDVRSDTELVVLPCVTWLYENGDVPAWSGQHYFESTLAILLETANVVGLPILATCVSGSTLIDDVRQAAKRTITVEPTDEGYRFDPETFRTAVRWGYGDLESTLPSWDGPSNPFTDPPTTEELADRGFFPEVVEGRGRR